MAMTANIRGAMLMTGSMTAFTVNDMFMKLLSDSYPFFQLLFLRTTVVIVLMVFLAWRAGVFRTQVSRRDRLLIGARTVAEAGGAYFFLNALFNMPIANATAILQALPLTVTLAAAVFLGEPVGWRRIAAIIIGLIGVLIIVRPGTEGFTVYSIYAVVAVVFITARDILARQLSPDVPSTTVAFFGALGIVTFAAVGSLAVDWQPMGGIDGLFLVGSAVTVIGGYMFSVMVMRVGDIGAIAPFRYTSLLVAMILGLVVFKEWPDALTLLGASIVVATGLFTLWRERQSAKSGHVGLRPR